MQYAKATNKAIVFFEKTDIWTSGYIWIHFLYGWTITYSDVLQTFISLRNTDLTFYLTRININVIFFSGRDRSTRSVPIIGRSLTGFTCSIRSDGQRLVGVPLIVADFLRGIYSTFTFAFKLFRLPLERVAPRLIRNGCCLTIAEDRLLGATSYHKKKLNNILPEMKGMYELRPTEEQRRTMWDLLGLEEDKDLLPDCIKIFYIFFYLNKSEIQN